MTWRDYSARPDAAAFVRGSRAARCGAVASAGVHVASPTGLVFVGIGPRAEESVRAASSLSRARSTAARDARAEACAAGVPLRHHFVVTGDFELEDGLPRRSCGPARLPDERDALAVGDLFELHLGHDRLRVQHDQTRIHFHWLAVDAADFERDVFLSALPRRSFMDRHDADPARRADVPQFGRRADHRDRAPP
jgi:hypothetical protein